MKLTVLIAAVLLISFSSPAQNPILGAGDTTSVLPACVIVKNGEVFPAKGYKATLSTKKNIVTISKMNNGGGGSGGGSGLEFTCACGLGACSVVMSPTGKIGCGSACVVGKKCDLVISTSTENAVIKTDQGMKNPASGWKKLILRKIN